MGKEEEDEEVSDSCIVGVDVAVVILHGQGCVVLCGLDQIEDSVNLGIRQTS